MVSEGSLTWNENILFECKVFCDWYFYPVESSLTLKLSVQKPNGVHPSSLSPLAEGICQKIVVAVFTGGEN